MSIVVCLEDSVPDSELAAAERNAVDPAARAWPTADARPADDLRPGAQRRADPDARAPRSAPTRRARRVRACRSSATSTAAEYLDAVVAASEAAGRRLLVDAGARDARPQLRRVAGEQPARRPPAARQVPRTRPGRPHRRHRPVRCLRAAARARVHGLGPAGRRRRHLRGRQRLRPGRRRRLRRRRAGVGVLLGHRADVQAAAARVAVRRARGAGAAHQADRRRPGRADPRGGPRPGQRADRQDGDPPDATSPRCTRCRSSRTRSTPTRATSWRPNARAARPRRASATR